TYLYTLSLHDALPILSHSGLNYIEYTPAVFETPLSFAAGNPFVITRADHALDQPGVHGGSLMTGDPPVCPWPAGQNNEAVDACRSEEHTSELQSRENL